MSGQRKKIREAIKALLVNKTPSADRVWTNRPNPLSLRPGQKSTREQLPAILIYTKVEDAEVFNEAPREYLRTVEVIVEVAAAMNDTIDDTLDEYAEQIEDIILEDDSLGQDPQYPNDPRERVAAETRIIRTNLVIADGGEIPIGAAIITFEVDYYKYSPGEPSTERPPFKTADIRYNQEGKQAEEDEAHDHIDLPQ